MLAFAAFAFVAGAVLAAAVPVRQFAVGLLVLLAADFAQQLHVGVPVGHAMVSAVAFFVCAQFGYVIGVAAKALLSVRSHGSTTLKKADGAHSKPREPISR